MNKEIELKPCPFCGANAKLCHPNTPEIKLVVCENWDCNLANCHTHTDVWNTRPIETQLQAENTRLQARLGTSYTGHLEKENSRLRGALEKIVDKAKKCGAISTNNSLIEIGKTALQHNEEQDGM